MPRAELMDCVYAMSAAPVCRIVSDCSYVVKGCLHPHRLASVVKPNGDLWQLVLAAQKAGCRAEVVKIKAHQSMGDCRTEADFEDWVGNDQADREAKAALRGGAVAGIEEEWGCSLRDVVLTLRLMADVAVAIMSSDKKEILVLSEAGGDWGSRYGASCRATPELCTPYQLRHCPLNEVSGVFARAFLEWFHALRWPQEMHPQKDDPGISFVELGISFELNMGVRLPRKAASTGQWVVPSEADLLRWPRSLSEIAAPVAACLRLFAARGAVFPALPLGTVQSLGPLGYRTKCGRSAGVCVRPRISMAERCAEVLKGVFCARGRKAMLCRVASYPLDGGRHTCRGGGGPDSPSDGAGRGPYGGDASFSCGFSGSGAEVGRHSLGSTAVCPRQPQLVERNEWGGPGGPLMGGGGPTSLRGEVGPYVFMD